ncbi:MAG: PspA/IM30 family protein, partial [Firmicutes bacterium]|nr:PspA/IM30 family protein [Bacillota bacterium]
MANVLTRFADIMSANINSVLSKAEAKNADKLLEKYIADARRDLEQLKSETAAVIAEEMAQGRKLADCEANISKYTQYAEAAVRAGNDDDARKFLTYKQQESAKL